MITFAQAREIARGAARKTWEPIMGDLYISPEGCMDSQDYGVFFGARQYMVDQNMRYFIPDLPVIFVNKVTGEARMEPYINNERRINAMTELTDSGA